MMELRAVTAILLRGYDIAFAPETGEGVNVLEDTKEQFTGIPGKLMLVFSHRKS